MESDELAAAVTSQLSPIWATVEGIGDWMLAFLPRLLVGLVAFLLIWLAGRGIRNAVQRITRWRDAVNMGLILGRLAYGGVLLLGMLVAVTIMFPSVRPVDVLSLLGVGSVAIGFAFKDILQNYLAGILILLRQPFRLGDQIIFKQYEGTVEAINTRATLIRTYDGRRVVVPNGELYTNAVTINTAYDSRRSELDIGVGYDGDPRKAAALILAALRSVDGVLATPAPEALITELAPYTVVIRARWWTDPHQREVLAVRSAVAAVIKEKLVGADVDLPFPTTTVLFHDRTDDGRTRRQENKAMEAAHRKG